MVSVERAIPRLHPGFVSGLFYSTWTGSVATGAIPAADRLNLYPFYLGRPVTVASLSFRVATGGAGSAVKTGIWIDSSISHRPVGAPIIVDNTGQATTSSGVTVTADVTDKSLSAGWYWAGSKATGTMPSVIGLPQVNQFMGFYVGHAAAADVVNVALYIADTYSNDMPTIAEGATFSSVNNTGVPILWFGAA